MTEEPKHGTTKRTMGASAAWLFQANISGRVNVLVVGTDSPLILLMPEEGLLYILSSSDPLCGREGQVRHSEATHKPSPMWCPPPWSQSIHKQKLADSASTYWSKGGTTAGPSEEDSR